MPSLKGKKNQYDTESSANYNVFPSDLNPSSGFCILTAFDWDSGVVKEGDGQLTTRSDKYIQNAYILPLPVSGINDTDTHNIAGEEGYGDFGEFLQNAVTKFTKEVTGGFSKVLFQNNFLNDQMKNIYKSLALRNYNLQWSLIPKSAKESDELKKIIDGIRYDSLPDYGDGNVQAPRFPNFFQLRIYGGDSSGTFNPKLWLSTSACMINNLKVSNDNEGGKQHQFIDGKPYKTNLEISFVEIATSGAEKYAGRIGSWNRKTVQ